jgi:hypothetical protein
MSKNHFSYPDSFFSVPYLMITDMVLDIWEVLEWSKLFRKVGPIVNSFFSKKRRN